MTSQAPTQGPTDAGLTARVLSSEWQPIETAPKDGTRIIVRCVCFRWNSDVCQNVAIGHKWVEARWAIGMAGSIAEWQEWCGDESITSTDWLCPDMWMPLPISPTNPKGEA